MIHIRLSKIVVLASCALLGGIPGLNNILDYDVNLVHVQHVMSMDTLAFMPPNAAWRGVEASIIHHIGYIMIIISEVTIGVLGLWGSFELWKSRNNAADFNRAKGKGIMALTLGVLVWFTGFLVIGGEWFLMWLSEEWNSQQAAFRLVAPFMFGLIFLSLKDEDH